MEKKLLKQKIDRLWMLSKKDLDKILKDTTRLVKKGEAYIKDKSEEGKKMLETMALALLREKLYYELGKRLAKVPKKRKGTYDKKTLSLLNKIKSVNLRIKKIKKK